MAVKELTLKEVLELGKRKAKAAMVDLIEVGQDVKPDERVGVFAIEDPQTGTIIVQALRCPRNTQAPV